MKNARKLHLYLGLLFAPSLLFFAFTGALQTFGLHERSRDGGDYQPPAWIQELAQIHKKQSADLPQARARGGDGPGGEGEGRRHRRRHRRHDGDEPGASATPSPDGDGGPGPDASPQSDASPATTPGLMQSPAPSGDEPAPPKRRTHNALKWYFVFTAVGLILSTLVGIYMAFRYNRDRRLIFGLLTLGTLIPIVLVFV